jgi:hypothetical protein
MSIILDYHRTFNTHQSPGPDVEITLDQFVDTWKTVLQRYSGNPRVTSLSIFNEIQTTNKTYTQWIQTEIVNRLETLFPGRFHYYVGGADWGKNASGLVFDKMLTSNFSIELHHYGFLNSTWQQKQSFFNTTYPIFIGEFGFTSSQLFTANEAMKFFRQKDINDICIWTLAHSVDTDGIFKDDCENIYEDKVSILSMMFDGHLHL